MRIDADGEVVILNLELYNDINNSIEACNIRGNLGGIDMVPKCARVDSQTGALVCPTGGATDGVPPNLLCLGGEQCTGTNPYCDPNVYTSCGPNGECICDEDPVLSQ